MKIKFSILKKKKNINKIRLRESFLLNCRLLLKKKFVIGCYYNKYSHFGVTSVCNSSGKHNSILPGIFFKRQNYRTLANFNKIPNIVKKCK